jgi:AcrR family transcriptional regulator
MPYRPTAKTEARKQATREPLVRAALAQVAEGGFAAAGIQATAARAGVAVGTVYRHFPSKSELVAEVFRRAAEHELAVVLDVTRPDRRALAAPTLAYAQIAEPVDPAVESERLRLRRGYRDAFASVLADGVRTGELRPHDQLTVAAALVGALGEALVGPLAQTATPQHHEALVATLVGLCLDALPEPTTAPPDLPADHRSHAQ